MVNVDTVVGFVKGILLPRYDHPTPIPIFHKEMWELSLSGANRLAFAAPRGHAKSTAITLALALAFLLFRLKQYCILLSDTESQAIQFLGEIRKELTDNDDLKSIFPRMTILKDAATDLIVQIADGHEFRIQALGTSQKARGRKWNNKRPDLIIGDDLENDEMMENDITREKARNWFFKALVPSLAKNGTIIIVGTILHLDSILMRLMSNKSWTSRLYRAHKDFDDFSELLWPEQWPIERLKVIRQEYIDDGYEEGYAAEYLNDPIAQSEAFFKDVDFVDMEESDYNNHKTYYAAMDLAISDQDKAAYTVMLVGGLDCNGTLCIEHVIKFRGDSDIIIQTMFEVQQQFNIDCWFPENGQIWQAILGELYKRMEEQGIYLNFDPQTPVKDKRGRARPIQARMRARGVKFDKKAPWFSGFKQELLQFPKGRFKDQVDAFAWLGIAINKMNLGKTKQEMWEDEVEEMKVGNLFGRDLTTGY